MNGMESGRAPLKELVMVKDKKFTNCWRLQFKEGGMLPANLSGLYSKVAVAAKAISDYNIGLNRKKIYPRPPKQVKPKVEANGEKEKESGS